MSAVIMSIPRFLLGQCRITPGALDQLAQNDVFHALARHQAGNWGDLDEHDRRENEVSLNEGHRLFSMYHSATGVKFYIITDADRAYTTVLLPEEY